MPREYPYQDGDAFVLAPGIIQSGDQRVINYKGENYYRSDGPDVNFTGSDEDLRKQTMANWQDPPHDGMRAPEEADLMGGATDVQDHPGRQVLLTFGNEAGAEGFIDMIGHGHLIEDNDGAPFNIIGAEHPQN